MIRNLLLAASFGFLGLTGIGCGNSTTPSTTKPSSKEMTKETTKEVEKTPFTKVADPIVPTIPGADPKDLEKKAEEAKAKLEEMTKAALESAKTDISKELDPVMKDYSAMEAKLTSAKDAEKEKLTKLAGEVKPIKESIVEKLKGLGELKDLANLPKMKEEILKLVADLKAKLASAK
jgi:hypothetical protein